MRKRVAAWFAEIGVACLALSERLDPIDVALCRRECAIGQRPRKTCGPTCGLAGLRKANRKRSWKERALDAEERLAKMRDAFDAFQTWRRP